MDKNNNKNIRVSIVVAIYLSEKFLDKLIESIINQTYRNIEIILVDDGSPDKSGEICDKYAKKDNRIRVIHKKNGGTCEARNEGIKIATGDYLVIVDGDDWLENDYIEYMLNLVIPNDADMGFSDNLFTTRDRTQIQNDKIELWSAEKATMAIIYPHMDIGPWNKIYKMSVIKKNNITFSVPWSGEGLYFASMVAQCSNYVGVGHKKVYNYRLNNINSGLTNYNVQIGINALNNIKYINDNLKLNTKKIRRATQWHIWKNYNFLLLLIIATGQEDKYNKEYNECKTQIRKRFLSVLIKSKVTIKWKFKIIFMSLFPVFYAKRAIKKQKEGLKNDKMK